MEDKIINTQTSFCVTVKYSQNEFEQYIFDKWINGIVMPDQDYLVLEREINNEIFKLLTVLLPLHHDYVNKVYDAIRNIYQMPTDEPVLSCRCCAECINLFYEPPRSDQPYQEFWCGKQKFDGVSNMQELYEHTECEDFKETK